jgi:putative membrane protein
VSGAVSPVERTDLAWQRTGLGLLSVGGLLGYRALRSGAAALQVVAVIAGLLGLAVLGVLAPLRYRLLERSRASGHGVSAPATVAVVTAAVVVVALSAMVAVLLPR